MDIRIRIAAVSFMFLRDFFDLSSECISQLSRGESSCFLAFLINLVLGF